ncbi:MAG: AAA family ATPase [Gammaproteobacteria bacterium]|nr:AAA family ATPase [Gammaproteobacteria bacterium]
MAITFFVAGVLFGVLAAAAVRRLTRRPSGNLRRALPAIAGDRAPAIESSQVARDRLFRLRREIEAQDDRIQHPDDLVAIPEFGEGVELLASDAFIESEVIEFLGSSGYVLPSMAAKALPRRVDIQPETALGATLPLGGYPLRFVLEYLQTLDSAITLPLVLRHGREWWWEAQQVRQRLREYFQWAQAHEPGHATVVLDDLDDTVLGELRETLGRFREPVLAAFLMQLDAEVARRRESRVLGAFGRVGSAPTSASPIRHPELERQLDRLHAIVAGEAPHPVLLSGEHGVGKTTLVDLLVARLHDEGWLVFEASAAEILAGQKFIGELEGRIREMLAVLERDRTLWRVPDFLDLLSKGSHSQDPRGILDLVMPAIERGELLLIGEITPRQLSQLLLARPMVKHHFEIVVLPPMDDAPLCELTTQWAQARASQHGQPVADERTLAEAQRTAAQFFPELYEPGRLLRLLEDTLQATVAQFFRQRVLGQDEAVECLLDRIAMLKAGLVDNTRPIGVFLFAGPTGTGKTELAKTLGELLFGSSERLLRLDMSEYQSEDAASRLIDDGCHGSSRSLTARIREQPFSVVLLDEFEKAHPKVWDLFLQVFDDARLSDRNGNLVDFRHSIIILTSNVGSTLSRTAGPGFTSMAGGYSRAGVEKALFETFRREFLNRLDRIVLFNPLDRGLMREILHKELEQVLTRRGLRNRDWAVEWEPSAIEFLLDRGFTPDLGARPLRRAIEHHLLAPLARSIVEHRAPKGDQFLFVRSAGDGLEVEFIDPDVPTQPSSAPMEGVTTPYGLRALVFVPANNPAAVAQLNAALEKLRAELSAPDWGKTRDLDFAAMADGAFWAQPGRFEVLDRIERRDRIQSAVDTAERLAQRMSREGGNAGFVGRMAQLLWLLNMAVAAVREQRPQDALLLLTVRETDRKRDGPQARMWWQQILGMYMGWAKRRNMRVEVLQQDAEQCRAWLALSGFGAYELLQSEHGLHVLECEPEQDGAVTRRICVQVQVAPDLPGRVRHRPGAIEEQRISRRYRAAPSPLVRDTTRGWRSGRLDRILAGDFDVVEGS